ncbi:MAG: DUF1080 domain-containing protein [Alphaproteobacteria bacterium]|nr:DUF1080 domain-containing protein [Alphaproteobacteria bacterium]MBU1516900.1 DUF1080 domain-containing protein [Alphaproteobacteria bacterium]MBU2092595.1 DUF1080 domain-containing protein [Alphaproteobacteria bacterium]MBU2151294.1 DUF1080 domain-containing protein [Alphaproteobacteria bacterium]MBU2309596.1 DUF1080 domain-containing protein [Alphaproteobacteria bacterium]
MVGKSWRIAAAVLACVALPAQALAQKAGPWRPIFDGKTLDGWTAKIARHPLGENWHDTFIVKDGAIQVSYAGYDKFAAQFGHLFYKTSFKAYRLKLSYRVLEPPLPDTPAWARGNSGVMFHSQSPESMGLNQPFPVSVEFQILGADGPGPRPTGSVCTPGLSITIDGKRQAEHCTTSTGPTIPNGTWTKLELEVLPNGQVTERINGAVVFRYADIELDPKDPMAPLDARRLIADRGGVLPVTEGYIALQSEGHPIEFKDIQIQTLK